MSLIEIKVFAIGALAFSVLLTGILIRDLIIVKMEKGGK